MIKNVLKKVVVAAVCSFIFMFAINVKPEESSSNHNRVYFYNMSGKGVVNIPASVST